MKSNATLSFGVHVHDMTAVTHLSVERLAVRMVPRFWEDSESTQHDKEGRSGFANADMRSASQCCRSPIELVDLEPSMSTLVPLLLPIAGNDEVLGVCLFRYVGVSNLSIFLPKVLSPVIDSMSDSHARLVLSGVSDSELLPLVKSSMRSGHEPQPSDWPSKTLEPLNNAFMDVELLMAVNGKAAVRCSASNCVLEKVRFLDL